MKNKYCVYVHYLDNTVIYVGSGTLNRATSIYSRNNEHKLDMLKENFKCEIVYETNDRQEAFKEEYKLGYYYKDLNQAKYFQHDMRGKNNPMSNTPVTNYMTEDKIKQWKENLSSSMTGENNGFRTECILHIPFENKKLEFKTIIEAKKYVNSNYGLSLPLIDKTMIDIPFGSINKPQHKNRKYCGLMIERIKEIGKR